MSTPKRSDTALQLARIAAVGALALLLVGWGVTSERAAQPDAFAPAPAAPPPQTGLGFSPQESVPESGAEPYVDHTTGAGSESGGNYGFTARAVVSVLILGFAMIGAAWDGAYGALLVSVLASPLQVIVWVWLLAKASGTAPVVDVQEVDR